MLLLLFWVRAAALTTAGRRARRPVLRRRSSHQRRRQRTSRGLWRARDNGQQKRHRHKKTGGRTLRGRLGSEPGALAGGGSVPVAGGGGGLLGGLLGGLGGGGLVGGLALNLFRVAVEEQVGQDGPGLVAGEGAAQAEDFTAEQVPDLRRARGERSARPSLRLCVITPRRTRPIEWRDLLLVGMATSTNLSEASVSHRAMTGMLTYAASRIAWWSTRGSVTMMILGSLNERVM